MCCQVSTFLFTQHETVWKSNGSNSKFSELSSQETLLFYLPSKTDSMYLYILRPRVSAHIQLLQEPNIKIAN